MPIIEASTVRKMLTGMVTTATVFGSAQSLYALESINPALLSSVGQATSYNLQINDNILDTIKLDITNAGFTIVSSDNDIEIDDYFGEMKLVNYFVALNNKTIEEMVSTNMQIVDKYNLFDKEKIVLMFYAV